MDAKVECAWFFFSSKMYKSNFFFCLVSSCASFLCNSICYCQHVVTWVLPLCIHFLLRSFTEYSKQLGLWTPLGLFSSLTTSKLYFKVYFTMLFKGLLSLMFTCNYIEECKNQTFAEKYKTTALLALTANQCCSTPKERLLPKPSCSTSV